MVFHAWRWLSSVIIIAVLIAVGFGVYEYASKEKEGDVRSNQESQTNGYFLFAVADPQHSLGVINVTSYSDENTSQVLKTIEYSTHRFRAARLFGNTVYVIAKSGGLVAYDVVKDELREIQLPGLFDNSKNAVADMYLHGNDLLYLKGICAENFDCDLYRYDMESGEHTTILEDIKTSPVGGVGFAESQNNGILLEFGSGDAGIASKEIKRLNEQTKQLETIETYSFRYCGESGEYCDEQQVKENERFENAVHAAKSVSCEGKTLSKEFMTQMTERGAYYLGCAVY